MDLHFAVVATVFTALFFAGTTARTSFNPSPADLPVLPTAVDASNAIIKSLPEPQSAVAGDSNIILPSEISKSDSDVSESEIEKSRMFGVDLTPRTDFARFHAINRHFFDEPRVPVRSVHRRPYRHFVNPFAIARSEISHGEEVKFSGETGNVVDVEAFHRRAPAKRMKVKHDYGHRHHLRHHHHHHHHLHLHHGSNDGSISKHVSDREKVKKSSSVSQHKEKNREHEAGFMKRFRKFLKHTFD